MDLMAKTAMAIKMEVDDAQSIHDASVKDKMGGGGGGGGRGGEPTFFF